MNNPLSQKAQYYLNESDRLSEELNSEVEYSAVLEAVLEELVGTENFLKIMENYIPALGSSSTHKVVDGKRVPRTAEDQERRAHHFGKIMDIRDRAASGVYDAQYAFTQAHKRVQQTDQHQDAFDKAKSLQLRAHAALTLQGGNTGDDPAKHPKMMNFASGGATPEQRASVGVARPAVAARPAAYGNDAAPAVVGVDAQKNDVTDAIAAKRASNTALNIRTGAAGRAMAFNLARKGGGTSVGPRGSGGTPRSTYTGKSKGKQGLLFPINASYEPDLMQSIRKFLVK